MPLKNPLKVIGASVFALHIIFIFALSIEYSKKISVVATRKVVVKTIDLRAAKSPSPTQLTSQSLQPIVDASNSKASAPAIQKPKVLKKEAAPSKPTPQVTKKAEATLPSKEKISKIQEALGKINTKTLSKMPHTEISNELDKDNLAGPSEIGKTSLEAHYTDELARRLRASLKLPERGEVTIRVSIARGGKVTKVVVENLKDSLNQKYLEKQIPLLSFPSFGSFFGNESQHTFTIVLRGEL